MSLNGVDSSSGALVCTATDGTATSNPIVQDLPTNISESSYTDSFTTSAPISIGTEIVIEKDDGSIVDWTIDNVIDNGDGTFTVDTTSVTQGEVPDVVYLKSDIKGDFIEVKNITAKYEFANISNGSTVDTLITTELIKDGDNLVIVKDDDSIHEIVASGTQDNRIIKDGNFELGNTDEWEPWADIAGTTLSVYNNRLKINATQNYGSAILSSNELVDQETYHIKFKIYNPDGKKYYVQFGSVAIVAAGTIDLNYSYESDVFFNASSYEYKLLFLSHEVGTLYVYDIELYNTNSSIYQMETTSTTQGEVPSRAYRVDESVEFNNVTTNSVITYLPTSTILNADASLNDTQISPSPEVASKVNMSATGNKMTELKFDLYRKP